MRGEKELARERKRERERDSGKSYLGRQMGLTVGGKTYKRMNASWVHVHTTYKPVQPGLSSNLFRSCVNMNPACVHALVCLFPHRYCKTEVLSDDFSH